MRRGRSSLCIGEFARNVRYRHVRQEPTWRRAGRHGWLLRPRKTSPPPPHVFAAAASSPCRPRRSMAWLRTRHRTRRSRRMFAAKGRPAFNPLIAHVLDVAAAQELRDIRPGRRTVGASVLAGAANPGSAGRLDMPRESARARGPRHARAARARASDRARADRGGRARRSRRPRPIARAGSARRRPLMCSPISTAGSTGSLTAALRDSGSNRRSWHA